MARKPLASSSAARPQSSLSKRTIRLTRAHAESVQDPAKVTLYLSLGELIAYSQDYNFTRLNLIGGKVLEVKETTDEIDRLVRAAAGADLPNGKSTLRQSARAR